MISAIIPVYQESVESVIQCIERLEHCPNISQIVIAASKHDPYLNELESEFNQLKTHNLFEMTICESYGRAIQMNHGATSAISELLIFIHCDTQLPNDADDAVINALKDHDWGRFDVKLDNDKWAYSIIAWFINKRSRLTKICTGDQCIFVTRDFFQKLGGFPIQALMEDVEFSKRAKKYSLPAFINQRVITSARRWQHKGVIRTVMLMWLLRGLYWLGVSPDNLVKIYQNVR